MEHSEERHQKKYVNHPNDVRVELADEEYEERPDLRTTGHGKNLETRQVTKSHA